MCSKGVPMLALCVGVLLTTVTASWINTLDGPASFTCPAGLFLSHINSEHHNKEEDRVWNFGCSAVPADGTLTNCEVTNYVNDYDLPFTFACPGEGIITGMDSIHSNHNEDRKFKFHCCEIPEMWVHGCAFTDWENDFDHILDYHVPRGKVLRGVGSYHSNHDEDRRFKFEICDLGTQ